MTVFVALEERTSSFTEPDLRKSSPQDVSESYERDHADTGDHALDKCSGDYEISHEDGNSQGTSQFNENASSASKGPLASSTTPPSLQVQTRPPTSQQRSVLGTSTSPPLYYSFSDATSFTENGDEDVFNEIPAFNFSKDTMLSSQSASTSNATSIRNKNEAASENGKAKKHVSWGQLELVKFPIIPGDHPDCSSGPPLTIAWEPYKIVCTSIDSYELKRAGHRYHCKDNSDKTNGGVDCRRLSWIERRRRLRRLGFSDAEMRKAQEESEAARRKRERTISRLRFFSRVEEVQQSVLRRLAKTIHPTKVGVLETKYPVVGDSSSPTGSVLKQSSSSSSLSTSAIDPPVCSSTEVTSSSSVSS